MKIQTQHMYEVNNSVVTEAKRKYTKRLNEAPGKISYYKLRVSNEKIERVYKLGDAISVSHNAKTSKANESWDVKLYRPSIRPDDSIRFRTTLIVSTGFDTYEKACRAASKISKEYGIPFDLSVYHGSELKLSHTKRTIHPEEPATEGVEH